MKYLRYLVLICLVGSMLLSMVACSAMPNDMGWGGDPSLAPGDDSYGMEGGVGAPDATGPSDGVDVGSSDGTDADGPDETETPREDPVQRPAGSMTAGAWNDNDYYDFWKTLFRQEDAGQSAGKFSFYNTEEALWHFQSYNRVSVHVTSGEALVSGAKVTIQDGTGKVLMSAVTDAKGDAYLFTDEESGTIVVESAAYSAESSFTKDTRDVTIDLGGYQDKQNIIDIMFVVDVTGSMGDEISYLKRELSDVIYRIAEDNPGVKINLALLFYRDHGDEEVFTYFDFTDVTNADGMQAQQTALNRQTATGGGDTPEAVDEALSMAVGKQWSTGNTTKILFQILDAPPHNTTTTRATYHAATMQAAEKGIRFCPVICSGADLLTEYLMRTSALYTGGTFVFITDDSGIGNSHHDPELPNVVVEALNSLLVRLVNGYHTGTFAPPVNWRDEISQT